MLQLIKMDIAAAEVVKLRSICHYNGHPLDARTVSNGVLTQENVNQNVTQDVNREIVLQEQK
jgi:hypothetical protein